MIALATGTRMKSDPNTAGLALASVRGIDYGKEDRLPAPAETDPMQQVNKAFDALRSVLAKGDIEIDARMVYAAKKWRSVWWFLEHELADFAYHTGQASYLRRIIAIQRKRLRKKGRQ